MSTLVVVVPLRPGTREQARRLLADGPPFELEQTRFDRHAVYLTDAEAVFVFEAPGERRSLDLPGEDPALWRTARAWEDLLAGPPRVAATSFTWERQSPRGES